MLKKQKIYYHDTICPTCKGHGKIVSQHDVFRVFQKDEKEWELKGQFDTLPKAKAFVRKQGEFTMNMIVAPNGEIIS